MQIYGVTVAVQCLVSSGSVKYVLALVRMVAVHGKSIYYISLMHSLSNVYFNFSAKKERRFAKKYLVFFYFLAKYSTRHLILLLLVFLIRLRTIAPMSSPVAK